MGMLLSFTDRFAVALGLWPVASFLFTLPILAFLYHRDGRIRFWSALGAYLAVLYLLGLFCFTLYPLPTGTAGPGITYGIPPQLDPLAFVGDIRKDGAKAVFQIAANVVFFVPLGFICGRAFGWGLARSVACGFATSLLVETAQLTGCFGIYRYAYRVFDVDDLIWNTGGAAIGWGCSRVVALVLPSDGRTEAPPTDRPGFVRRCTAFCLDMTLVLAVTVVVGSAAVFARYLLGMGSSDSSIMFWVGVAACLVIEGVIPWMRGGCTPGGGFVRMTFETRERHGVRRVLFYVARLATLGLAFYLLPLAVPVLLVFYLVARRMPYDFL